MQLSQCVVDAICGCADGMVKYGRCSLVEARTLAIKEILGGQATASVVQQLLGSLPW